MRSYRSVPHRGAAGTIMHVRSCMHTSIQYYRADRAAVEMHDGAAVRSTPLLASAGGQSTATRCIKGRKHCHNKASQLTESVSNSHTLPHMPGASAAAAMEDIVIDVPIVMTMENLAQVSVSWR